MGTPDAAQVERSNKRIQQMQAGYADKMTKYDEIAKAEAIEKDKEADELAARTAGRTARETVIKESGARMYKEGEQKQLRLEERRQDELASASGRKAPTGAQNLARAKAAGERMHAGYGQKLAKFEE